jgi:hypothetical protein
VHCAHASGYALDAGNVPDCVKESIVGSVVDTRIKYGKASRSGRVFAD